MFDQIVNQTLDTFNGINGLFVGEARFDLPPESEKALLNLVNYNLKPQTMTVLNLDFYQPSENYSPPSINDTIPRTGIIRAIFVDSVNGFQVPYDIRFRYLARAREEGINPYFFSSVEWKDVVVDSVQRVSY